MNIDSELEALKARLPELAWQLRKLGSSFPVHTLPRGLFRQVTVDAGAYIIEINEDIDKLSTQLNLPSMNYLASKIHQKIAVLVAICANMNQPEKAKEHFQMDSICTRQQWLERLNDDLQALRGQREALLKAMRAAGAHAEIQLPLQAELGALEKQLTLVEEQYAKANQLPSPLREKGVLLPACHFC